MSYKVVRDAQGYAVAFGPDSVSYEPTVGVGQTLTIEPIRPVPTIAETKTKKIAEVKAEARRLIELIAPLEDQAKLIARAILLTRRVGSGTATPAELTELDALEAIETGQLQPIRDASNAMEVEMNALTTVADIEAYNVATNVLWP